MGRSVNFKAGAEKVLYLHVDHDSDADDFQVEQDWADFKHDLVYNLQNAFPSLGEPNHPQIEDRGEVWSFLDNKLVTLWLSSYCGLVSVSITINQFDSWYEGDKTGLAKQWLNQNDKKLIEAVYATWNSTPVRKIGNFSNGEGLFEKVA